MQSHKLGHYLAISYKSNTWGRGGGGGACNTCPGSSVFSVKCFYTARGTTGNTAIPMQTNKVAVKVREPDTGST